jgi:hypothetical protein
MSAMASSAGSGSVPLEPDNGNSGSDAVDVVVPDEAERTAEVETE